MYDNIVLLGIVLSILFYELTGYSPSGLIVSGYIALCLHTPERIAYTLLVVLITYAVAKVLSHYTILYGRRRFAAMILISFAVNFAIEQSGLMGSTPGLIGCLVPGIMAQEFERQGIAASLLSLGVVTAAIAVIMLLFGMPVLPAGALW